MLETLGLKLSGKKDELINRIEKHFEWNVTNFQEKMWKFIYELYLYSL